MSKERRFNVKLHNVETTSIQRLFAVDVESTLNRCYFNVVCLLGTVLDQRLYRQPDMACMANCWGRDSLHRCADWSGSVVFAQDKTTVSWFWLFHRFDCSHVVENYIFFLPTKNLIVGQVGVTMEHLFDERWEVQHLITWQQVSEILIPTLALNYTYQHTTHHSDSNENIFILVLINPCNAD